MGVRSQTRAIMKLTNCTFTYEGAAKPSLIDVSCALSLSSRVGILGPNGAGKSTLIKLLTVSPNPHSCCQSGSGMLKACLDADRERPCPNKERSRSIRLFVSDTSPSTLSTTWTCTWRRLPSPICESRSACHRLVSYTDNCSYPTANGDTRTDTIVRCFPRLREH
jgi:hypothetical protein